MKKSLLLIAAFAGVSCSFAQETSVRCGTMQDEAEKIAADPEYAKMRAEENARFEQAVKDFVKGRTENLRQGNGTSSAPLYIIPVVYHVLYSGAVTSVTTNRILDMHQRLNEDWARLNADTINTPPAFDSVACDMQIQFCLATIDPSGNPTSGIIYKSTTVNTFTTTSIKNNATGGDNPWNVNNYLNIWIGNLGSALLGAGSFPPISSTYGVVLHYCAVGGPNFPGTCAPFQYGRILTHEIGHCFDLRHLSNSTCIGNGDLVTDTPNQDLMSSGCPTFPSIGACGVGGDGSPASNVFPGEMFMNFMDYTNDSCMNMFTCGQAARAQATVVASLMSLANAGWFSCGSVGITENYLQNVINIFPNPSDGIVNVTGLPANSTMKVFNSIGEETSSEKISGNETTINLSENPEGMYFFRIITPQAAITKKVALYK